MPVIQSDGCPIYFEIAGPQDAPILMLSNSLGTNLHMWGDQVKPFTSAFRLLRYDRRGHGQSGVPKGPYSMEQFGRDAIAVMDAVGAKKVHWCGLSMGGMVGQWLGAHAPERIDRLILSNTSCYYAAPQAWDDRIAAIRKGGLAAIANGVMNVWFTKDFHERSPDTIAYMKAMLLECPAEGYIGSAEAIRDMDHREIIKNITAPTLVIAGRQDMGTTVEAAEFIRSRIPGASLTLLDAAHISNVELPGLYADTVLGFLTQR
jgi:3-oxoadipate enol-lactonase